MTWVPEDSLTYLINLYLDTKNLKLCIFLEDPIKSKQFHV